MTETYSIHDPPIPEAVRQSVTANNLRADRITEIRFLETYFYCKPGENLFQLRRGCMPGQSAPLSAETAPNPPRGSQLTFVISASTTW